LIATEAGESGNDISTGVRRSRFVIDPTTRLLGLAAVIEGLGFEGANQVFALRGDAESVVDHQHVHGVDAVLDLGVGELGFDYEAALFEEAEVGFARVGGAALARGCVGDYDDVATGNVVWV
jgi:hypothetical protein